MGAMLLEANQKKPEKVFPSQYKAVEGFKF